VISSNVIDYGTLTCFVVVVDVDVDVWVVHSSLSLEELSLDEEPEEEPWP
jgi:hypothetical protein